MYSVCKDGLQIGSLSIQIYTILYRVYAARSLVFFERENEMAKPVLQWLSRQHLLVKSEFVLPWGICDLVGLSFNQEQVARRLALRQHRPIGPLQRIDLLRHIPDAESGSAITLNRLRKSAEDGEVACPFERDLQMLIANRFVIATNHGSLQKVNGWMPLHERIVAIELKLYRISEAIAQALSNRAFATESYIALPAKTAERLVRSARHPEFRRTGIGVLGVTRTTCKVLVPAVQVVEPDATLQTHCVERFWRTRDSSSSTVGRYVRAS